MITDQVVNITESGPVRVHVSDDPSTLEILTSVAALPPNTRHVSPAITVDRGYNFHGELVDEYYCLSANSWDDPLPYVMWLGYSGCQENDDVSRCIPVAFIDEFDGQEEPERADAVRVFTESMFYAWIVQCSLWTHNLDCSIAVADDLEQDRMERVFEAAVRAGGTS